MSEAPEIQEILELAKLANGAQEQGGQEPQGRSSWQQETPVAYQREWGGVMSVSAALFFFVF